MDMHTATYLTTDELSARIKYDSRTIRSHLKDSVYGGADHICPFGGRKTLYIWETIEADMRMPSANAMVGIPMANGGAVHG